MLGRSLLLVVIYVSLSWAEETRLLQRSRSSKCSLGFIGYKSSCYMFSHMTATYEEAQSFCRYFGSRLAEINSRDEEDFIRGYLKRKGGGFSYYISGTDLRAEGIWTWENPVRRISYLNWYPDEPNNLGGDEHCLQFYVRYWYVMNDSSCEKKDRFVCEQNM